jgi:hypothetical protein
METSKAVRLADYLASDKYQRAAESSEQSRQLFTVER